MSSEINHKQIKAMGDIMRALNSIEDDSAPISESVSQPFSNSIEPVSNHIPQATGAISEGNIEAMRSIMNAFRSATDDIREAAQDDPLLMESLCTEKTERGVRIAEWEIVVTEKKNTGKYYDVICDDIAIATDLRLYEAALLLTQELNRGSSITSDTVRHILSVEAQYARNLDDAIRYSRMIKVTEGAKRDIARARLSESKAKALAAKEQINEIR